MGENAAQIADWNGVVGERWAQLQTDLDQLVAPYGAAALEAANVGLGERALDVGCGCGDTSLILARAVGPPGQVLGIDISAPMLAVARARLESAALPHLSFAEADAASASLPAQLDLVFSRFGVMFFDEPVRAFAHLRSALKRGGRVAFCCWRSFSENTWARAGVQAVRAALSLPEPPADPHAPGPFAFAARERLVDILAGAGFTDIEIAAFDAPAHLGATLEQAIGTVVRVGPAARLVRELPEASQMIAVNAIREALTPFDRGSGIAPPGAVWIVTARTP